MAYRLGKRQEGQVVGVAQPSRCTGRCRVTFSTGQPRLGCRLLPARLSSGVNGGAGELHHRWQA